MIINIIDNLKSNLGLIIPVVWIFDASVPHGRKFIFLCMRKSQFPKFLSFTVKIFSKLPRFFVIFFLKFKEQPRFFMSSVNFTIKVCWKHRFSKLKSKITIKYLLQGLRYSENSSVLPISLENSSVSRILGYSLFAMGLQYLWPSLFWSILTSSFDFIRFNIPARHFLGHYFCPMIIICKSLSHNFRKNWL